MKNKCLRIFLVLATSVFSICSFAGQLTTDEVQTAQRDFFREPGAARNIHEWQNRFPDGVKGFEIYPVREQPWGGFQNFANADDHDLQGSYCYADTVARARAETQQAYLTAQNNSLFTATKFVVTDVVKAKAGFEDLGKTLDVVRRGGELVDQGERLRVLVADRPEFEMGHDYFLFLASTKAGEPLVFHADEYVTMGVDGDRLNISIDNWNGLRSGDSYIAARDRLARLLTQFPCRSK